ncbi:heavy-metal-associated domain-containing protein [Altericroceibacterium endophyticum]|uniref:Heavy-metal-associated domain-containing protein n=1 Tax=Altericroceibacterium endophyticum TaxID=1808508 RepID=A0A6I4T760_9SPHN|nr:heavy-metal-associated domain-containing protein [Altericroceibacterium endophyticum]MXO66776.1 heavy-metal-associated domain-containing protein [Altericroceibacterium endophyticum]
MTTFNTPLPPRSRHWLTILFLLGALAFALVAVQALIAQVSGDRGIAPVAKTTDIQVNGVTVDVTADSPEEAREKGWREAQRKAWEKVDGPDISDSRIESMVAAIIVEKEQLGPKRYIATLGVIFDRTKAGALLGGGGERSRSAPLLTLPVLFEGGHPIMFETRNPWQRAWAEYQAGASAVDYVRPSGAGGESLLLTYGQLGRRSRLWWGNILDQFGAADVISPIAKLERQWPGGPVKGTFTARYGPDSQYLGEFTLTADNEEQIPAMLGQAVRRFDEMFTQAVNAGKLRPDPTLESERIEISPLVQRLIDAARADEAAMEANAALEPDAAAQSVNPSTDGPDDAAEVTVNSYVIQFVTPDASAVDATLGAIRGTPGVRSASTSSIAIGGTSVMRVSYAGELAALAAALEGRGWQVTQGSNALSISR